jgi:cAMP-binding proteins - catabolite gene activator and regulatory subunit of cAMP-dependent protein kinases
MEPAMLGVICSSPIFGGLLPEQVEHVLPCLASYEKTYLPAAEERTEKGALGLVLEGDVLLKTEDAPSHFFPVRPGGIFGEAAAFSGLEQPYWLYTENGARVLYLRPDFFFKFCSGECLDRQAHLDVKRNLLALFSERTAQLNREVAYLSAPDLKTKIAMYLVEQYEKSGVLSFALPLNRDKLADFFAVARPSLSREMIALRDSGLIDFYRSNVTILDLDRLRGYLTETK